MRIEHVRPATSGVVRLAEAHGLRGPQKGSAALVGAGMMGDRADVIFAAPEEIGGFIRPEC
jgi:cytochrome c